MTQALTLPSLQADHIPLINRLLQLSYHIFSAGLLPTPLLPDLSGHTATNAKTRLTFHWNKLPFYLLLETPLATLTEAFLPTGIDVSTLSEELILALFEKRLLESYHQVCDVPLHLKKMENTEQTPEDCYLLRWQPDHSILRGQLCIPHQIAPALISELSEVCHTLLSYQDQLSFTKFDKISLPLRLTLGEMSVSLSELRDLQIQDLLFFEKSYFNNQTLVLHLSDTLGFTAKLENDTCTVITSLESYRAPMDNNDLDIDDDFKKFLEDIPETSDTEENLSYEDDEDEETYEKDASTTQEEAPQPATLEEINIRLTFDVGHIEIPLGEIAHLSPGYTFNLGRSIHKSVTIRANGTPIGKGELVDIEGTIGVSIVELSQKGK